MKVKQLISLSQVKWLLLIPIAAWISGCTQPRLKVGRPAPAFEATTIGQAKFQLSDLHGSYVLLYFWSPTCDSCRTQHEALMNVYQKYQNASFDNGFGFNMVGIVLNTTEADCMRILREDRLRISYHILDNATDGVLFDSPLAKLYGVSKLPTLILLDGNTTVLGIDLTITELDQLLHSKLL